VSGDAVFENEEQELRLLMRYRAVNPSAIDLFHYSFSHAGLLTGK